MKEMITVAASFLIVVALAFYMYVSTQKHSIAVVETQKLEEKVSKNYEELKSEVAWLKQHTRQVDSIFHKNKNQ